MKKIVTVNGKDWEISDEVLFNEIENRGAPINTILAELDNEAAYEVIAGNYPNARTAAKSYIVRYGGEAYAEAPYEVRNNKLRDIARRIQKQIDMLQLPK